MKIHSDHSADLIANGFTSHVYDDGSAYLDFGLSPGQNITIWAGKAGADLAQEAGALRKLAEVALNLAAGLDLRAESGPETETDSETANDDRSHSHE